MRWGAADGIANGGVDGQVEIRAVRTERIGIAGSQFIASLPPAMLADDNAWVELWAETRPGSHSAGRGAHVNPISILDAARRSSRRMQFDLRMQCALAQAQQCTMLALAKQAGLGARQDQRIGSGKVGARNRADWRFDKVRKRRITVVKKGLGPEFHFPRRRREAAWISSVVPRGMLDVTRRQGFPQSGRLGSKLIQGDTARPELLAISSLDVAVPELLAEAKARCEVENEIGVRPCLTRRSDDRLPKLNMRLCGFADLKSGFESFAFEAGGHRQHDIRQRGSGGHEQIGMGVEIERGERGTSPDTIALSEQEIGGEADAEPQQLR